MIKRSICSAAPLLHEHLAWPSEVTAHPYKYDDEYDDNDNDDNDDDDMGYYTVRDEQIPLPYYNDNDDDDDNDDIDGIDEQFKSSQRFDYEQA